LATWPIQDPIVQSAVSTVLERSERQEDLSQLDATFVDPGISIRLANNNNEIVYGRRGTGKTHVLKVLQYQAAAKPGHLPVYMDMRELGSNSLWEDGGRPASLRVANLLRDVLKPVHAALLEYVTRPDVNPPTSPYEALDRLANALTESVLSDEKLSAEDSVKVSDTSSASVEAKVGTGIGLGVRAASNSHAEGAMRILREGRPMERILFQELGTSLAEAVEAAGLERLLLLLDEWTAVPADLQPLLAEFIKRVCFPNARVTVKIAALEYRSLFGIPAGLNNVVGFELGADISASLELDDYFVFDRDNVGTLALFSELLRRHVSTECDSHWLHGEMKSGFEGVPAIEQIRAILQRRKWEGQYLTQNYSIADAESFVSALFDDQITFNELVRAGEGVARDFMNIFKSAFFDTLRRKQNQIDKRAIRISARNWYEQDKAKNVDSSQQVVLERIVNAVMKEKARSFLFSKDAEKSDMIKTLFDYRVIHLVQRGYIDDPEKPGEKFNVYTLDFGTYVELLGTVNAPTGDFTKDLDDPKGVVVPFHDDRAIRRIVLPIELLEVPENRPH
jgi:hypothetical protein